MHSAGGQARQVVTSQVPRSTCPRGLPVTLAPNMAGTHNFHARLC